LRLLIKLFNLKIMADTMYVPAGGNGGIFGGSGGGVIEGLLLGGLLGGNGLGMNRGGFGGGAWGGYGGTPAASAVATDIVLNPALQGIQNQIQTMSTQINQNQTNDLMADVAGQNSLQSQAINDNINGTTRDLLNSIANLSTAQATGNFTTLSSINGLGRDITAQSNQNALQQLNSFNQLNTTLLQSVNVLAAQNQNSTNQIIAQGVANAAAQAACCCELKQSINESSQNIMALINANTMQDLRDRNVELSGQVSNNAQNQYLTSTIISHLAPRREAIV